jgi:hypothetical protein
LFLDKKVPPQNLHTQVFCPAPPPENSSAWLSLAIIIGQGGRVPRFLCLLCFSYGRELAVKKDKCSMIAAKTGEMVKEAVWK